MKRWNLKMANVEDLKVGMTVKHNTGFTGVITEIGGSSSWSDVVVEITDEGTSKRSVGYRYTAMAEYLTVVNKFKVGDIVAGTEEADSVYGYTDSSMTRGEVIEVHSESISVKILEHSTSKYSLGRTFPVNPKYFKLVEETEVTKLEAKVSSLEKEVEELKETVEELETENASLKEVKTASGQLSVTVEGNVMKANSVGELEALLKMLTRFTK
jgi:hypothetical protein